MKRILVRCCVCDQEWDALSDEVLRRVDGWWCRSERACQRRKAELAARMQAALDAVWASLEADGWRWPA